MINVLTTLAVMLAGHVELVMRFAGLHAFCDGGAWVSLCAPRLILLST